MKSYSKAPSDCTDRVAHLIKCFHPDLHKAGLRVDVLSVTTDGDGPALTHQGYAALAVVRILDSKARAKKVGDCEIIIDEERYLGLTDAEKDALLDHELYHVELRVTKKTGRVKLDEHGRPKLGLRKHDHQFGWFSEIAARHGAAAVEVKQATRLFLGERQTYFAFIGDQPALPSGTTVLDKLVDNASVGKGVENFVNMAKKDGMTVEIRAGGKSVKIDADGVHGDITDEQFKQARQLARDAGYLTKSGVQRAMKLTPAHTHALVTKLIVDGVIGPVEDDRGRFKTLTEEKAVVQTADGRSITPTAMMGEVKEKFERARTRAPVDV